jgi:hypothetical protein
MFLSGGAALFGIVLAGPRNQPHTIALGLAILRSKTMSAGNFVALLAMTIVVWSVFAIWGEPWETKRGQLVSYTPPAIQVANMPDEAPLLPDRMQVSSISRSPAR